MNTQFSLVVKSVAALALSVSTACSPAAPTDSVEDSISGHDLRLAWFGNTPDNQYDNATFSGITQVATQYRSTADPFYCGYDPQVQLTQCQQAITQGCYDIFLLDPNDASSIIPCVTSAAQRGISVVAVDLPIGTDPTTANPQVPGQVGAALTPAAKFGDNLAPLIATICAPLAECNIVYLAGSFTIDYDIVAMQQINNLLPTNPNIHVIAMEQAFYDPPTANTIISGILAQNPNIQVVAAGGDQMAEGAEQAIDAAGSLPNKIQIIGGGAGAYGVAAVRAGRWYATFLSLPFNEGVDAAQIGITAARGKKIKQPGIDPVVQAGYPPFMTVNNLSLFANFVPQWPG